MGFLIDYWVRGVGSTLSNMLINSSIFDLAEVID